ncbi:MAG: ankyrin repeat domain-containing protein [Desulfomonilia bacterium]
MDTKAPIEGAVVSFVYEKYPMITGPGGGNASIVGVRETMTDERGEFRIAPFIWLMGPNATEMDPRITIYKPGYVRFGDGVYVNGVLIDYDDPTFFEEDKFGQATKLKVGGFGNGWSIPVAHGVVELPRLNTMKEVKEAAWGMGDYNKRPMLKKALVENDISAWQPYQGRTALISAAREGNEVMVEELVKTVDDVDYVRFKGMNALISASRYGHAYCAKVLLEHGANVNYAMFNGYTALMTASESCHPDTVKVLLNAGADPNAVDTQGESAMLKALERMTNKDEQHVLEIVKALVEHGVDVNYRALGKTALTMSVSSPEIMKFLIDSGVDLHSDQGNEALIRAALDAYKETIILLLESGVDINGTAFQGNTALMKAVISRDEELVRFCIERGSKVNISNSQGQTALMNAAYQGRIEIVRLLLDAGADVHAKNSQGETAAMIAQSRKLFDVVKVLQDAGGTRNEKNNITDHDK